MRPLEDVRVLSLEQYGAGPYGSLHLAHLGADVIKIEDPNAGGDIGRYVPPYAAGTDSLFFEAFNHDKRSIALDIRNPAGRQTFEALVSSVDAVYSNLRGDVPEKLQIRYEDLKHLNPRIVCCSLSGFGMTGPRAAEPGYDYVLQGYAGWMSLTGEPEGPPTKTGLSLVDYSGGLVAALSLVSGIHAARRDGRGLDCDVSLFDTAVSLLTYQATWYLTQGLVPSRTRRSAHPSMVPFQAFEARDGWLVIACPKEKFWERFTEAIGMPELLNDQRFTSFANRSRHRSELEEIVDPILKRSEVGHWLDELRAAGVPCAPVNNLAEALCEEQTLARQLLIETEHPRFGTVTHVGSPARVGENPTEHRRAPQLGEDTEEVLRSLLGYGDAELARLAAEGAFGAAN